VDVKELRILEVQELGEKVSQLKQELFHLRCQLAMGRIENPMRIRQVRRDIARAKTIYVEKERSAN
jgi:large subunit ribosomal protein L29